MVAFGGGCSLRIEVVTMEFAGRAGVVAVTANIGRTSVISLVGQVWAWERQRAAHVCRARRPWIRRTPP